MQSHNPPVTQSTLSALERARARAVNSLHACQDQEDTARAQFKLSREHTAHTIHAARLDGVTWKEIGLHVGNIAPTSAAERLAVAGIDRPGSTKKNEDTWPAHALALQQAYVAEQATIAAVEDATLATAAAIALARVIGHSWATITDATGISRKSQLERMQRAFNTSNLAVPNAVKAAEYTTAEHASSAQKLNGDALSLWQSSKVYSAVGEGVATAVQNELAAHFNRGDGIAPADMAAVVGTLEATHQRAVTAAVAAIGDLNLADLSPTDVDAIHAACQTGRTAAAQAGSMPDGGHDMTATVFRPADVSETSQQLDTADDASDQE